MWSHYAGSHTGFCIEFKSEHLKANKVYYQSTIPSVDTLNLIELYLDSSSGENLGKDIWLALRTKLDEWKYEEEYRFQADNLMLDNALMKTDKCAVIEYMPNFVESIIFGCRTSYKIKDYISSNMPFKVNYKQAISRKSSIEIIDLDY